MNDQPKRRLQFGIRTLLELITVVAFVLVIIYGKSTGGGSGRYQMGVGVHQVFVVDSHTGKTWMRYANSAKSDVWQDWAPNLPEFEK
jgi:hypothetical protein